MKSSIESFVTYLSPWQGAGWYLFLLFHFMFWMSSKFWISRRFFDIYVSLLALIGGTIAFAGFYAFILSALIKYVFNIEEDAWFLFVFIPLTIFLSPFAFYAVTRVLKEKGRWPI